MSALDVKQAKQALGWRLAEWGLTDNPHGKAASFIDDLVSRGWQMSPDRESRPRPPRPQDACRTCGRAMHQPDRVCDHPSSRPVALSADASTPVANLRALLAHRETEPETDQPEEGDHA